MNRSHCNAKKFRWCNVSDIEQRKCAELAKALQAVLPPRARNSFVKLSCIKVHNVKDCIKKIWGNTADAMSLDAADTYTAATLYDLTIVAKELYQEGGCLYSVAVVQDGSLDLRQLKGKRSCHDGAWRTAGWNIPLGFLLSHGYLQRRDDQTVAEATSEFFGAACAPGAGSLLPNLCELCQGQKSYQKGRNYFCETTNNEPLYGPEGALRCLEQGVGDVAFLDDAALVDVSAAEAARYRLLCPDGTQASLAHFRRCHLGYGPGNAVVTRHNYRKVARKFLTAAQHLFGRNGKHRQRFQLFNSTAFKRKNLMFRDATMKLLLLPDNTDVSQVLGLDYVALLKGLGHQGSSLENSIIRWCCISAAEQSKCDEWALNIKSTPLVCIRATSASHCVEMIKREEVDAASLDATHAYIAGKCGLVPVAAEHYGLATILAVSVVKAASRSENMFNLAGRRSCHGNLYSPAGWLLLTEYTINSNNSGIGSCNINAAYTDYFRKGCMPGSSSKGKLCKVCIGRQQADSKPPSGRCAANHDELYYGNLGALRCLVGNSNGKNFGDVAFLEHHSLMENIEYLATSGWAPGWTAGDFELLCPDGGRAPVTEWDRCNLGPIPPNIVMTRSIIATKIKDFLMKAQAELGTTSRAEFQLFHSQKHGESDLLFKDATKFLVPAAQTNVEDILGDRFINLAQSVFSCVHSDTLGFCNHDVCSRL
ncbi:saxiphilin-like [Narcine bancroftii]|uniref:saxiphilin-like n=1 Tax=Narcine bancroftii TaxID=1343680 RepID=UPI0038323294